MQLVTPSAVDHAQFVSVLVLPAILMDLAPLVLLHTVPPQTLDHAIFAMILTVIPAMPQTLLSVPLATVDIFLLAMELVSLIAALIVQPALTEFAMLAVPLST